MDRVSTIRRLDDGAPPAILLAGLFAFALAVRLWFSLAVHRPEDFVFSDMWVYDLRARNLVAGSLGPWDTFTPAGYPAFLAALYAISGRSLALIAVVQAVLGAATAPLTLLVARRVTGSTVLALAAGVLVAAHLPLVFYGGLLLAETPFTFGVMLSAWLLLRAADAPGWRTLVPAGLALGVSAAIRPNLLLVLPLIPVWSWLGAGVDRRLLGRRNLAFFAWILAGALPVLATVSAHNSRLLGRPTGLGTNGGLNFFLAHAPVKGAEFVEGTFTHRIYPIPNLVRHEEVHVASAPFYDEGHFYRLGLRTLLDDPWRLVASLDNLVEGAGLGEQAFWPGWKGREGLFHRYGPWFFGLGIAPALAGLAWNLRRRERSARLLLAAFVLSAAATMYGFLGDPRMRVPFDPLLIVLAVEAWAAALGWGLERAEPGGDATEELLRST